MRLSERCPCALLFWQRSALSTDHCSVGETGRALVSSFVSNTRPSHSSQGSHPSFSHVIDSQVEEKSPRRQKRLDRGILLISRLKVRFLPRSPITSIAYRSMHSPGLLHYRDRICAPLAVGAARPALPEGRLSCALSARGPRPVAGRTPCWRIPPRNECGEAGSQPASS